jgi:hypothetical protein
VLLTVHWTQVSEKTNQSLTYFFLQKRIIKTRANLDPAEMFRAKVFNKIIHLTRYLKKVYLTFIQHHEKFGHPWQWSRTRCSIILLLCSFTRSRGAEPPRIHHRYYPLLGRKPFSDKNYEESNCLGGQGRGAIKWAYFEQ